MHEKEIKEEEAIDREGANMRDALSQTYSDTVPSTATIFGDANASVLCMHHQFVLSDIVSLV